MTNYGEEIERANKVLGRFRRSVLFDDDREVLRLEEGRLGLLRAQIHEWCAPRGDEEGVQAAIRTIFELDLPVCAAKKEKFAAAALRFKKSKDEARMVVAYEGAKKWEALEYDFQCLVAFRSLEHFALLWERDFADEDKVFKWSLDPNHDGGKTGVSKPFFFYFNQMVLQKKIKFISKQYPTGYTKTLSDSIAIAWLLGMDVNNDVLKVLGNPVLITTTMNTIVGIMTKPFFGQVFPKFAKWFEDGEKPINMFSICRIRDGELLLADSIKTLNLKVIAKDTPIDGIRVRFLFLDDVCRSKDAGNNAQHEKDIANYWNSWWKRNYNTDDFYIVVGGTAYSIYDIISTLIRHYSGGKMKPSGRNKYTYTNLDETAVFIKIPKLDPITDESTFPKRFPTEEARRIRSRDYRMFMAMEQQQPLPPETTPFYWDNLLTYEFIPEENRSPFCWASLDPVRIGGDNVAMPIFRKIGELYYLVDCIYEQAEMERMYTLIVDKIEQHYITRLVIERNTDTSLKKLLDDMLRERGIHCCDITEIYTYDKKEVRITNMQNTIKTQLVFPAEKLYARSSMVGRFMYDIVSFSWKMSDNVHDDSIDATTMFCETFISGNNRMCKKIETFKR